jgi:hypothetical protein
VIIPTYNRRAYLLQALESLRRQTLSPTEIVVVDDGSADGTPEAVTALGDPRIEVIRHDGNRGVAAARNTGLEAARGELIAWLDSDDLARPARLQRQAAFLAAHPEVALVGCSAGKVDAGGRRRPGLRIPPFSHDAIAAWLLFRPAFQQSSLMGRAEVLRRYRYREDLEVCEDFDVFLRMVEDERLANLPQVLVDRRIHPEQTIRAWETRIRQRKAELLAAPLRRLGLHPSGEDLERHILLGQTQFGPQPPTAEFLAWAEDWLLAMRRANARTQRVAPSALAMATSYFWGLACRSASPAMGAAAWLTLARSPLSPQVLSPSVYAWAAAAAPVLIGAGF